MRSLRAPAAATAASTSRAVTPAPARSTSRTTSASAPAGTTTAPPCRPAGPAAPPTPAVPGQARPAARGSPPRSRSTTPVAVDGLVVRDPDQGREQGEQAEAVEGGVVAGHGQAMAARPDHDPQGRLGREVEAADQGGGVQGFAVDDQRLGGRTRVPDLAVEARPGQRDRAVEGGQAVLESVDGRGHGGGHHHRPGGPPVGEPQQGQGVGRSRRRQPRTAAYRRTPR